MKIKGNIAKGNRIWLRDATQNQEFRKYYNTDLKTQNAHSEPVSNPFEIQLCVNGCSVNR